MYYIYYFTSLKVCLFYCLKIKTFVKYPFYSGLQKNKEKKILFFIVYFLTLFNIWADSERKQSVNNVI